MTVPQPPNANIQLTDQQGRATPLFLKLLGELCKVSADGVEARVSALEASMTTVLTDIGTINTQIGSLNTTVGGHTTQLGNLPTSRFSGSAAYNPPNLAPGATTTQAVAVTGAALGMAAEASFSLDITGLEMTAYVDSANSVTVVLVNPTALAVNIAAGTLHAYAWNPA